MATAETQTTPPEITVLSRVGSIPLVAASIDTISSTLSTNAYTRSPYTTALGLSSTAYKYTEPLQVRLAPLLVKADGYANKAVDVVESRYPYPFKASPEEVATYVKERKDTVVNAANQTYDQKVRSPAVNVATGLDQQLAPIMDYFQEAVTKINRSQSAPASPTSYQYQRAFVLSKNLKDSIIGNANEQLKDLQASSVLVQRATETAQNITNLTTSSIANAQLRIHALSDKMISDLRSLQASLTSSYEASRSTIHERYSSLHSRASSLSEEFATQTSQYSSELKDVIGEMREILVADLPLNEKANRVGTQVKDRVSPVLDKIREIVQGLAKKGEEVVDQAKSQNGA